MRSIFFRSPFGKTVHWGCVMWYSPVGLAFAVENGCHSGPKAPVQSIASPVDSLTPASAPPARAPADRSLPLLRARRGEYRTTSIGIKLRGGGVKGALNHPGHPEGSRRSLRPRRVPS